MKPASFTYHDPVSIDEVTDLLWRHENARLLAGGQSLMPMMNFRLVTPDHLIDLNRVDGLDGIQSTGNALRFGAMTRQRDIELSAQVKQLCPVMQEALCHVGHCQTRNRGTIGGSLCHLDPSAELVNITALHDGTLHAESRRGARRLGFTEFATGYMSNALEPDELLVAVTLTPWLPHHGYAFVEVARRLGDYAIVCVSAQVELDDRGVISRAALALSGLETTPVRATLVERAVLGQKPSHAVFRAASAEAGKLDAMSDASITAGYRQHLARILTYRALERAVKRCNERMKGD
jgi:aerobic carbon-monoxide dehydrogenase medium subunit